MANPPNTARDKTQAEPPSSARGIGSELSPLLDCHCNKVWFGDCRDSMKQMLAEGVRVQMCVTSPPYFGLRDYGHPGQIGLEETPDEYVAAMVETFRLVRDLLADDGVLWLNIGDSYSNGGRKTRDPGQSKLHPAFTGEDNAVTMFRPNDGAKPKDLLGIPWRVAFALQADGWYLRQDIIWHKPNPMPESVTDRCTKSHEYLFLLSKRERYYYDADAIKETAKKGAAGSQFHTGKTGKHQLDRASTKPRVNESRKLRHGAVENKHRSSIDGGQSLQAEPDGRRNKRSVWTIPTQPYSGAHFAVFPEALVEPCILAGSRPGDIVLDPFFGSGTTGAVAQQHGRHWVGCELNREYESLQRQRTAQGSLCI